MTASPELPSSTLRALEVNFHGHSFSPEPPSAILQSLSEKLNKTLTYLSSGLLLNHHGPSELSATLSALTPLLITPELTPLINWSLIDIHNADSIVTIYFSTASNLLLSTNDSDFFPSDLYENVARCVRSGVGMLELAAGAPKRKSVAVSKDRIGVLLHVSLFLRVGKWASVADHALQLFTKMRRLDTVGECVAWGFESLGKLLWRALEIVPKAYREAGFCTPAVIVRDLCPWVAKNNDKFVERLPGIMDIVLPLVEDLDEESREIGIEALGNIVDKLRDKDLRRIIGRVAPVLRGGLVWRDVGTAIRIAPVFRRVFKVMGGEGGLKGDVEAEWERGIGEMIRVVDSLTIIGDGEAFEERLEGAVCVAAVVVDVMRERGLRKVGEWVPTVAGLMRLVAAGLQRGQLELLVFERAVDVLVEAMKWGWLLETGFRVKVFEECMAAVCEVRGCVDELREKVWEGVERALICLARCEGGDGVFSLVKKMRVQTAQYKSLKSVDEFFERVEWKLKLELDCAITKKLTAGQYVETLFAEIL